MRFTGVLASWPHGEPAVPGLFESIGNWQNGPLAASSGVPWAYPEAGLRALTLARLAGKAAARRSPDATIAAGIAGRVPTAATSAWLT
jgi:hypothetical protein